MILHTLIYRFPEGTGDEEVQEFFKGLGNLATSSGLVKGFDCKPHLLLPVDAHSKGMCATYIAQFSCADLPTLKRFSELPEVHEFIAGWRSVLQYEAAYANHERLSSSTDGNGKQWTTPSTP